MTQGEQDVKQEDKIFFLGGGGQGEGDVCACVIKIMDNTIK